MTNNRSYQCKNCKNSFQGNFCNGCGQKKQSRRLNLKDTFSNLIDLFFNLEKGLIYTTRELTVRPGRVFSEYIDGKRIKYSGPFKFLILCVALNTFLTLKLSEYGAEAKIIDVKGELPDNLTFLLNNFWNVLTLTSVPVFATFSLLFFKEYKYNFTENLVFNSYILGYQSLLGSLFHIVYLIICPECYMAIYTVLFSFLYFGWSYLSFFNKQVGLTLMKLVLTFVISTAVWGTLLFTTIYLLM